MSGVIVVVAPHPDDETLGCGGTLLRHVDEGDEVHWVIATDMTRDTGYSEERIAAREREIDEVARAYPFSSVTRLGHPTTRLDRVAMAELVEGISRAFRQIEPDVIYLPFPGDAHSDHRLVFEAGRAASKWFRQPGVRRVLTYETLSETEQGRDPRLEGFEPNVYSDISGRLDRKIEIFELYEGEVGEHPFPRAEKTIRALAAVRGAASGYDSAEAFRLILKRD